MTVLSFGTIEMQRKIANLITIGTIRDVDHKAAKVRIQIGETVTEWQPWLVARAGGDVSWWSPEIGEQVVVLSPSGDFCQSIIIPSLYQTSVPPPSDTSMIHRTVYKDGAQIDYNRKTHTLDINLPQDGVVQITAPQAVTVTADNVTVDATHVLVKSGSIDLGDNGGPAIARVGDIVTVSKGSSKGDWPIRTGSSTTRSV